MFARKRRERTTEEGTGSIEPWVMLEEEEMAAAATALRPHYPGQTLAPFARHVKNDQYACFDKGEHGDGKQVVILNPTGGPAARRCSGFGEWFDQAVAESQR